jgi:sugar phosphate permease
MTDPRLPQDKAKHSFDKVIEPTTKATSIAEGETIDLDETEKFLRQHNFSHAYLEELLSDKARQQKLIKKIDMIVLPLLAITYVLQYIDKQAMSYAAVFDLFTSTGISSDQYSWFASIFYLAYLIAEYPWVFAAQKWRMGKIVSGCVLAWGSVLMFTALSGGFEALATCRFLLGYEISFHSRVYQS